MTRLVVAIVATAVLTLAGAIALHVEVPNARADGPQMDSQEELLRAVVAGCAESMGLARVEIQAGVWRVECRPSLGVHPVKRGGR